MLLKNADSEIFIPDAADTGQAIARTTHMAVAAHQDDIEIMAYDGIAKCLDKKDKWFFGVVMTDGTGSIRIGKYRDSTDHEYKMVRYHEQKQAAKTGRYGAVALLDYSSSEIKSPFSDNAVDELASLIKAASPDIIYTHNLADKHLTHVAVSIKTINAVRTLNKENRPSRLYGCEVWRSLDWMLDEDKTVFDVDVFPELAETLLKIFESQISGAKKYDQASLARRLSNSTFFESAKMDTSKALSFAMDLTPLITDETLDISGYVKNYIDRFSNEVLSGITKIL